MSYMRRVSASLFSLPRQLNSFAELSKRNKVNYLSEGKTVVQFINHKIPNKLYLHSYNQLGFRLSNELFVYGPMALFPRFVLGWNIKDHTSINEDSLALFYLMVPKIDILIMGVEDPSATVNLLSAQMFLNSKGINVEILPVHQALETYNFLCLDGRNVGGAFLPPIKLQKTNIFYGEERRNEFGIDFSKGSMVPETLEHDYFYNSYTWEMVKFQQGYQTQEELREKIKELRKNLYEYRTY